MLGSVLTFLAASFPILPQCLGATIIAQCGRPGPVLPQLYFVTPQNDVVIRSHGSFDGSSNYSTKFTCMNRIKVLVEHEVFNLLQF